MIFGNKFLRSKSGKMDIGKPGSLREMCRICMMTIEYLKKIDTYDLTPSVVNMLNTFANIDIPLDDCLPSLICNNCYNRLMESINFKNLCIKTNNTLSNYILNMEKAIEVPKEKQTEETIKTETPKTKDNETKTMEFINVKPLTEIIEPSPELLTALGLIKVKKSHEVNDLDEIKNEKPNKRKCKKLYTCKVCGEKLFDYGVYRRHLSTHGECPYSCKICGERFGTARNLKQHSLEVHSGGRPYACTQCTSKFGSLSDLTVHLRKHAGKTEPHVCQFCPRRFSNSRQLKEHLTRHNSNEKTTKKCKKSPNGFGEYSCSQCDRKFKKRCDLERHERVHSGAKPYACLICGGTFQQAHNLTKHMVTHTGVRSFTCDICKKNFGRSDVLARHMHVHEVSKPHSCKVCSRTFARQSQLAVHLEKRHPNSKKIAI